MIKAYLIGGFRLIDANGVNISPKSQKVSCIITYLLLSKRSGVRRELLANLLWSESDEHHARASLRQAIKELRSISNDQTRAFMNIDHSNVYCSENEVISD